MLIKHAPLSCCAWLEQDGLEEISVFLRIPQRKPYGSMESAVKKALVVRTISVAPHPTGAPSPPGPMLQTLLAPCSKASCPIPFPPTSFHPVLRRLTLVAAHFAPWYGFRLLRMMRGSAQARLMGKGNLMFCLFACVARCHWFVSECTCQATFELSVWASADCGCGAISAHRCAA